MSIVDTSRAAKPGTFAVALGKSDRLLSITPEWLIAIVARFSIAAVFWKSGQTKIEGFAIDLVEGRFALGIPRFADSTIDLFKDEYSLPFIPPELAAVLATIGEHVFPVLILLGLATRLSALALLAMTAVIQVFVYPGAYPLHGVWAAVLLYLMRHGAGPVSLDAFLARRG
jgi:putative oxidoreductase